jgi:CHAT domain-containing protein
MLPDDWNRPYGEVLGGYAAVGRWVYQRGSPTPAPPARIDASRMAVVSGKYNRGRQLVEAEQEAAELTTAFAATPVDARIADVLTCLKTKPSYDVVHFAVHGNFDVTETTNGILMVDDRYLSPVSVAGVPPAGIRLVFLNACQLGQAQSLLGEPTGMVPAFLDIGADAVIAPLWKVDDAVAREVAVGLYEALRTGGSPAEYLRRQRQASLGQEGQPFGTRLAYLYFGHPRLAVTWHDEERGHD